MARNVLETYIPIDGLGRKGMPLWDLAHLVTQQLEARAAPAAQGETEETAHYPDPEGHLAVLKTAAHFWGGTDAEFRAWAYAFAHSTLNGEPFPKHPALPATSQPPAADQGMREVGPGEEKMEFGIWWDAYFAKYQYGEEEAANAREWAKAGWQARAALSRSQDPAGTPAPRADLLAAKILRETIQAHRHNVTGQHWEQLSPGQQEGWRKLAEQVVPRLSCSQEAAGCYCLGFAGPPIDPATGHRPTCHFQPRDSQEAPAKEGGDRG